MITRREKAKWHTLWREYRSLRNKRQDAVNAPLDSDLTCPSKILAHGWQSITTDKLPSRSGPGFFSLIRGIASPSVGHHPLTHDGPTGTASIFLSLDLSVYFSSL